MPIMVELEPGSHCPYFSFCALDDLKALLDDNDEVQPPLVGGDDNDDRVGVGERRETRAVLLPVIDRLRLRRFVRQRVASRQPSRAPEKGFDF